MSRKLHRELNHLLGEYRFYRDPFRTVNFVGFKQSQIEFSEQWLKKDESKYLLALTKQSIAYLRIFELQKKLNISDEELQSRWEEISWARVKAQSVLRLTPVPEGRDNKGVKVGSGYGGDYQSIRYPSKKRSKRTWRIFYEMFPRLAKIDNWDGTTSDKMK